MVYLVAYIVIRGVPILMQTCLHGNTPDNVSMTPAIIKHNYNSW